MSVPGSPVKSSGMLAIQARVHRLGTSENGTPEINNCSQEFLEAAGAIPEFDA